MSNDSYPTALSHVVGCCRFLLPHVVVRFLLPHVVGRFFLPKDHEGGGPGGVSSVPPAAKNTLELDNARSEAFSGLVSVAKESRDE